MPVKKTAKKTVTKKVFKKVTVKPSSKKKPSIVPAPVKRKYTIYIESSAFFPLNSTDGYIDLFQQGRHAAVAGQSLATPIVLPVGAVLKSFSIHYTNSTKDNILAFFLRKHADRHCPSGEIEMSFISLPPGTLPPDNFLTATDTTFPDGGPIKNKYLHYLEVPGTGDFGAQGKRTIRGISLVYSY
jgi:hypothetical protein